MTSSHLPGTVAVGFYAYTLARRTMSSQICTACSDANEFCCYVARLQVRMLNRLAKEHASMAGGIVLRQEPTDQRLNDRCSTLLHTND